MLSEVELLKLMNSVWRHDTLWLRGRCPQTSLSSMYQGNVSKELCTGPLHWSLQLSESASVTGIYFAMEVYSLIFFLLSLFRLLTGDWTQCFMPVSACVHWVSLGRFMWKSEGKSAWVRSLSSPGYEVHIPASGYKSFGVFFLTH